MATESDTLHVTPDVELSPLARALIRQTPPDSSVPAPSEQLRSWLRDDTAAIVATATLAGAGGRTIVDDKLTHLEQLVARLEYQESRLAAYEFDIVTLHRALELEAEAATTSRAEARQVLRRIAEIVGQFELDPDSASTHVGTAVGAAFLEILDLAHTAPAPFTSESFEHYIAQGLGIAARQEMRRSRAEIEDEGE